MRLSDRDSGKGVMRTTMRVGRRASWLALLAAMLLQGCAHTWVDERGVQHVVGLVAMELSPSIPGPQVAMQSLRARTFGLSLTSSQLGSSLALGFHDSTLSAVRDHSAVPLSLLAGGRPRQPPGSQLENSCTHPRPAGT